MNRLLGCFIVATWAVAVTALFVRDVLPYWRAEEPPVGTLPPGDSQTAIFAGRQRLGTCWVSLHRQTDVTVLQSQTELSNLPLAAGLGSFLVETTFRAPVGGGPMESFELELYHDGVRFAGVSGHRAGSDYSCAVDVGEIHHETNLDASAAGVLGDALRPFHHLPRLHVGQTWRVRMLDVTALLRNQRPEFRPQLVRVVGVETIEHRGHRVECFRIETDGTVAFADRGGEVLVQRVSLPLMGELELRNEPFDADARARARRHMPSGLTRGGRPPAARGRG